MTRRQLEHIIRAAAATVDVSDIVVIGSQAILGAFPNAPLELLRSMEADVFPKDDPQRSVIIDGAIGELSLFHETFGYFAHGVDDTTAALPEGWQNRLVRVENDNTRGAVGWCLDAADLASSKIVAGREKDVEFVALMVRSKLVTTDQIAERLTRTPNLASEVRHIAQIRVENLRNIG